MEFLPEITPEGKLKAPEMPRKLYTPPQKRLPWNHQEKRDSELNNLGRKEVSLDFSDSPHLNK